MCLHRRPPPLATGTTGLALVRAALRGRLDEHETWFATSAAVDRTPVVA